jgi:hypothetical protein
MRYIALALAVLLCAPSLALGQTGQFGNEFYVLAGETLVVKNQVPLTNDGQQSFESGKTCVSMHEGRLRITSRFGDAVLAKYFFNQAVVVNESCPDGVVTETTVTKLREMNAKYIKWQDQEFGRFLVGQKDYREEQGPSR